MKRIELVLLTFWLVILPLRSQTLNMRYDSGYNISHVNAIVSDAILEVFDEKRLEKWLYTEKLRLMIVWTVDEKGRVIDSRISGKRNVDFDNNDLLRLTEYIRQNDIRLSIPIDFSCPEHKYNYLDEEEKYLNKIRKEPSCMSFAIGFGIFDPLVSGDSTLSVMQKLRKSIKKHIGQKMFEAVAVAEQKVHYDQHLFDSFDLLTDVVDRGECKREKLVSVIDYILKNSNNATPSLRLKDKNMNDRELAAFAFGVLLGEYYKRYGDHDFFVWMCVKRIKELEDN